MAKTILCADDSATMQTVAQITFAADDYEYVGARSGDDALKAARDKKPDLILADAQMPDKTGYELCQAVKSDPDLKDIPVVVMCGNSEAYDATRGKQAGADGHVTKPWDTQQMLDKVEEFLANAASGGVKAADVAVEPPAKKERAPTPPPMPQISPLAAAAGKGGEPPRSMTLMGMPQLKMPGKPEKPPGVTAIPETKAPETKPAPPVKPPEPMVAKTDGAKKPDAITRPPMVKGAPTKRFSYAAYARKATPEELAEARASAQAVAKDAGGDLSDSQADALLKLSKEVVERIVWEAVPELAETIIRENLDKLAAK